MTPTRHLPYINSLILALVSLKKVEQELSNLSSPLTPSEQTAVDAKFDQLASLFAQLPPTRSFDEAQAFWDSVLTRRQRDIHQVSAGSTLGSSFMAQCSAEASNAAPGVPFDDGRLYKSLLSQLTSSSSDSTAASSTTRAVTQNKKGGDNVDRKASKGRKIRYKVHEKLVNFAQPATDVRPAVAEDVWFKSMFR